MGLVEMRTVTGQVLATYRSTGTTFIDAVRWETPEALLLTLFGVRKTATARCTATACELTGAPVRNAEVDTGQVQPNRPAGRLLRQAGSAGRCTDPEHLERTLHAPAVPDPGPHPRPGRCRRRRGDALGGSLVGRHDDAQPGHPGPRRRHRGPAPRGQDRRRRRRPRRGGRPDGPAARQVRHGVRRGHRRQARREGQGAPGGRRRHHHDPRPRRHLRRRAVRRRPERRLDQGAQQPHHQGRGPLGHLRRQDRQARVPRLRERARRRDRPGPGRRRQEDVALDDQHRLGRHRRPAGRLPRRPLRRRARGLRQGPLPRRLHRRHRDHDRPAAAGSRARSGSTSSTPTPAGWRPSTS